MEQKPDHCEHTTQLTMYCMTHNDLLSVVLPQRNARATIAVLM